mmetsp:Transcript_26289/g.38972  ORF Transcript_26289/g.38972 Transcript_26289/m.38972 type:complete len:610 (+) Transcript_26289:185-2014(+)
MMPRISAIHYSRMFSTTSHFRLYHRINILSQVYSYTCIRSLCTSNTRDFNGMGLMDVIVNGLSAQNYKTPTDVQVSVIPRLLKRENIVLSASTGSGKTLAYTVPAIQNMILHERSGYLRLHQRPRCLVLVPTRELAKQVLDCVKGLSHYAKVSSCAVMGGESYSVQRRALSGRVDLIVASPGRLVQHYQQRNLSLSEVNCVIIDEVDTMLTQGFGADIRTILHAVQQSSPVNSTLSVTTSPPSWYSSQVGSQRRWRPDTHCSLQVVMASATLTPALKRLLEELATPPKPASDETVESTKTRSIESEDQYGLGLQMDVIEVDGARKSLPNVRHNVEDTGGRDKVSVLMQVIQDHHRKGWKTMIFCNTIASCRAAAYAVEGMKMPALSYHGDLNSEARTANLDMFRHDPTQQYLICTDIAARGIDIPSVEHVVMFDFPLNPIDYLHRAGRTGRMGSKGLVTAIVAKRDRVLSEAIQRSIAQGLPLDSLSSDKRAYQAHGKLADVFNNQIPAADTAKGPRIVSAFSRSRSNERIVSEPGRGGILVKQPPRRIVSRTSRIIAASKSASRSSNSSKNPKSKNAAGKKKSSAATGKKSSTKSRKSVHNSGSRSKR